VPDVEVFFDPVCPFCWQTSAWVRQVARLRDLEVRWRFISLRFLNEPGEDGTDTGVYDGQPDTYRRTHHEGTRLLRVAAAVRDAHGHDAVGRFYEALGQQLWEAEDPTVTSFDDVLARQAEATDPTPVLRELGLPEALAAARDDEAHDEVLRAETREAVARAGEGVGTPILSFSPPDGPAFFGPVISELPSDDEALAMWDAVTLLARTPGFAELKRSLRTMPDIGLLRGLRG
jgi:2-hydroxychromene-2-carboxylate isomerase